MHCLQDAPDHPALMVKRDGSWKTWTYEEVKSAFTKGCVGWGGVGWGGEGSETFKIGVGVSVAADAVLKS